MRLGGLGGTDHAVPLVVSSHTEQVYHYSSFHDSETELIETLGGLLYDVPLGQPRMPAADLGATNLGARQHSGLAHSNH